MKKLLLLVAAMLLAVSLSACSGASTFEIAMITDSGGIDDESFNQGTWEGIVEFCDENDLTYKYYKPLEISDAAYLDTIQLAVEGGAKVVVTPGFLFSAAVYDAQTEYPDVKFVILDAEPHTADWSTFNTTSNTLPILFNEHESGFLAGYAAVKEGFTNLGFTGGMAVPAVVKFGVGYIAGAYYAAEEDGVTITLNDNNYTYFGNFDANDTNKATAATMYQNGVQVIFSAAGGAGSSVINAATESSATDYVIGVDVDQSSKSDLVITSAMKELGNAVKQALQAYVDGTFVGGTTVIKGVSNDGVGLPFANSVFANFTEAEYTAVYALLVAGTVVVPDDYTTLETFLTALGSTGYPTQSVVAPE